MSLRSLTIAAGLAAALVGAGAVPAFAVTAEAVAELNVRSCGSIRCRIVDVLHEGERVDVIYCEDEWCAIEHRGEDGFVNANYLERSDRDRHDRRHRRDRDDRDYVYYDGHSGETCHYERGAYYCDDAFADEFYIEPRRNLHRVPNSYGATCSRGPKGQVCIY